MSRTVLSDSVFRNFFRGLMLWLGPLSRRFSVFSISLLLVVGCSAGLDKLSLSQQTFQQAVNLGFLAPQIRTFDFQTIDDGTALS